MDLADEGEERPRDRRREGWGLVGNLDADLATARHGAAVDRIAVVVLRSSV